MDPQLLQHLLGLAEKTGDRLIVVDPASRQPFVLMGLPQYEAMVSENGVRHPSQTVSDTVSSVAPDPIVAKANAEVAAWRASQQVQQAVPVADVPATIAGFTPEPLQSAVPDDDRFYVEPLE